MANLKRIKSIDRMRGITCFCMVFFSLLNSFPDLGILYRLASHDIDTGINLFKGYMLADFFEPLFLFIIGFNYIRSFKSRVLKDGKSQTYLHFITRYLTFIGAGYSSIIIKRFDKGNLIPLFYLSLLLLVLVCISVAVFIISILLKSNKTKDGSYKCLLFFFSALGITAIISNTWFTYLLLIKRTTGVIKTWGILQTIGFCGLVALLFVNTDTRKRIIASILIFVTFTIIHEIPGNMELIDIDAHGGIVGGLGFSFLLLNATIISDLYFIDKEKNTHYYLCGLIIYYILAIVGSILFVINKGSVSPGYILVSLVFGASFFYIFNLFENYDFKFNFFEVWGRNPFLVFVLQTLFSDILLDSIPGIKEMSVAFKIFISVLITLIITIILYKAKDKNIKI